MKKHFFENFGDPNFSPTIFLTGIKFSPVGISYWCNTSFEAESRAEYDLRGYISIGAIFEFPEALSCIDVSAGS